MAKKMLGDVVVEWEELSMLTNANQDSYRHTLTRLFKFPCQTLTKSFLFR